MAGASTPSDNPIPLNITALVDIIFCLAIFFMCCFHFRQTEGKMEGWLPRERGVNRTRSDQVRMEEIRILLEVDPAGGDPADAVIRRIGPTPVPTDAALRSELNARRADFERTGLRDCPVVIDAEGRVPWKEVLTVMSICKVEKFKDVQLAMPR